MASIAEKMAKQFEYQRTLYATSGHSGDLVVSVDWLAEYLAAQTRGELRGIRRQVRAELERLVVEGAVRRWLDVYGPSLRAVRKDHYVLTSAASAGD